ncbi:MAG: class I SAM-dependent DNA methyltransferase, partial [Gammaproteobacteria bacterium]|nr:class I SAM-dependent DNA methyltransferase [Gammaproteobacteria bacterium]
MASHTADDGSDLQAYLKKLFNVLNLEKRSDFPDFLQKFPYVNGGLFADEHPAPVFTAKSRKIIIECGALNWKEINPDIFGSMIQAVIHTEQRGSMGMHYTSVVNIMKVIEPLFLNGLYGSLEMAEGNENKLTKLLDRLYHLKVFDPACGSGNFLIIAYKELCKLEIKIFKQLQDLDKKWETAKSGLKLTQFYGIELDDFAHETAKLSLWLAEHQMNLAFKEVFGDAKPTLPLSANGNIACGNATQLDWDFVCPKSGEIEIVILGNPPYLGQKKQSKSQKNDLENIFSGFKGFKTLDYISCWFMKAVNYLEPKVKVAFVSTNSIVQGSHVGLLWPILFRNNNAEIFFAHRDFPWSNSAKYNAGVTCVIVGLRNKSKNKKFIIDGNVKSEAKNINSYLVDFENIIVSKRGKPISNIPK